MRHPCSRRSGNRKATIALRVLGRLYRSLWPHRFSTQFAKYLCAIRGELILGVGVASARTIVIRRLKGSRDSTHYLERDELAGLRRLPRQSAYVFVNERGDPFKRMGIARLIERAGEAANIPFAVHVHMLRHSCGYALANKGMDTRRLQHYLGHASITNTVRYSAMSPEPFRDIWR
jgi:integrase